MAISYENALRILQAVAKEKSSEVIEDAELVPITSAIGRICNESYHSPESTPASDTSAMDGFAVVSEMTSTASPTNPITFCVIGTIACGTPPEVYYGTLFDNPCLPCYEIMTGAQFPSDHQHFDAVIRFEDTEPTSGMSTGKRYIKITKPVERNQNRRLAATDFLKNDLVVGKGVAVAPHHVMALAALGVKEVSVLRRLRVAVLSTGEELQSHDEKSALGRNKIRDSNGPYIEAVLSGLGVEVTKLGIVGDNPEDFVTILSEHLAESPCDLVITTGGVSRGKFDFVGAGIEAMGVKPHFHKVEIRPGHPVLFATLPKPTGAIGALEGGGSITPPMSPTGTGHTPEGGVEFFGLPGNPLATAVCLRFLVIPYLRALLGLPHEDLPARGKTVQNPTSRGESQILRKPKHLQVFWHGKRSKESGEVVISEEQGSSKMKPVLDADCWVGVSPGKEELRVGDEVDVFGMYPASLGSSGGNGC